MTAASTRAHAGHPALIAEDDEVHIAELRALVESRGDVPHVARTVEEALALIAQIDFCYYLVDQQLPFKAGDEPMLGGGEAVLRAIREKDARRNGAFHVTPAIVVTSYSGHEDFVGKMYDLGASGFMSKPIRGSHERLLDKVRVALERAGRGTHAGCAALAVVPAPAKAAGTEGNEELGTPHPGGIAAQLGATSFAEIAMKATDGHTLRITCRRKRLHATYIDLGLATKTRKTTREWAVLQDVCEGHGTFRWKTYGSFNNAKQRVFVLAKKLKTAFGLEDDPFHPFRAVDGWRARFFASTEHSREERRGRAEVDEE